MVFREGSRRRSALGAKPYFVVDRRVTRDAVTFFRSSSLNFDGCAD